MLCLVERTCLFLLFCSCFDLCKKVKKIKLKKVISILWKGTLMKYLILTLEATLFSTNCINAPTEEDEQCRQTSDSNAKEITQF